MKKLIAALKENPNTWIFVCKKPNKKTFENMAELNIMFPKFINEGHDEEDGSRSYYCMNIVKS